MPCTEAACEAGVCRYAPLGGIAGLRCQLSAALAAPLCEVEPVDPRLGRVLVERVGKAQRLLERAEAGKRPKARLRAAARHLRRVQRQARRSERAGRLSTACRARVEETMEALRQSVLGLVTQ
jgi:hypothetical protein